MTIIIGCDKINFMRVEGEFVNHDICAGCPVGKSLVNGIEAGNKEVKVEQAAASDKVTRQAADLIAQHPGISIYLDQMASIGVNKISSGGLQRAVCTRNGPGRFGKCGVKPVPNA